jgi:hypothetical protein
MCLTPCEQCRDREAKPSVFAKVVRTELVKPVPDLAEQRGFLIRPELPHPGSPGSDSPPFAGLGHESPVDH